MSKGLRRLEPSEAEIELSILAYLVRVKHLLAWKNPAAGRFDPRRKIFVKSKEANNPYARNGVPDILCVIKGRLLGFEVKSKVGRQSEAQKLFERDLRSSGGHYYLVRSVEEVITAVKEFARDVSSTGA